MLKACRAGGRKVRAVQEEHMLWDYLPVNLNGAGNSRVAAGNAKPTYFCTFWSLIHMQTMYSKHLLKWIFLKDSGYCVNM